VKRDILFVDDEQLVLDSVARMLYPQRGEWEVTCVSRPEAAWDLIRRRRFDAVVLDVKMPGLGGLDLLDRIRRLPRTARVPVVMLTGLEDRDLKRRALELGAIDLLHKPVDADELRARLRSVLLLKSYEDRLRRARRRLEQRVRQRTEELFHSRLEIIWRLGQIAEHRDEQTGNHVIRVGCTCRILAEELGMDADAAETLFLAAPLHDIGKIGIPDAILRKRGPLSPGEWTVMQQHCLIGERILKEDGRLRAAFLRWRAVPVADDEPLPDNPILHVAAMIARTHHEKWDGAGYPMGMAGQAIPLEARIVAIADVFDALTHERPYKPAFSQEAALEILAQSSGSHFDPAVHEAFLLSLPRIEVVQHRFADHVDFAAPDDSTLDQETPDEARLVCR
jgi:putative two-component system response regulator